jgi:hypothetical protein
MMLCNRKHMAYEKPYAYLEPQGLYSKIQRGLDSMAAWCKRWDIKINEAKTQAIYFTRRNRPPDSLLKLNGRNIPFVNSVKYLGVLFYKRMTWRLHIQIIKAKAFIQNIYSNIFPIQK